ncbi:MAG: hypothetical protein HYS17_03740 [Micavibrio aeruginosavorus]|uniref:Uncharacterized protein n=1 Tax=Micavibrio aeruginosavorus TaxID=349221 RepID=A0A7T5UHX7_9BACT|nr:MAG: hypothetical protein HYS17_03740 [Micavibrio aeruginosavorus]
MLGKYSLTLAVAALLSGVAVLSPAVQAQDAAAVAAESPAAAPAATASPQPGGDDQDPTKITVKLLNLKNDIRRCTLIEERAVRLTCYDHISETLGYIDKDRMKKEKDTLQEIGFWQITRATSTMGEPQTTLRVESSNTIETSGMSARYVNLVIRCTPGKTEGFLDWKAPVTRPTQAERESGISVNYRYDASGITNEKWEVSTDMHAVFMPDAISFVRNIMNKKRLIIEIIPTNGTVQGVSFDIQGIEKAADEIVKDCYK